MNRYELVFLFLAELSLLLYLRWQCKSWRAALLLAALSLPPLYLSLERVSQFLTYDALVYGIILESLHLASADLGQWLLVAARTTTTSLGLLAAAAQYYAPEMTEIQGKIILKNLHWLTGFILLLWLHYRLRRDFISESNKKFFFVIFIYTALLLPTNNIALKVFNYDLLSMLLGILALLHLVTAIKEKSSRDGLIGIVLAWLAAQEKLIASPILIFALAVYGYLVSQPASKSGYARLFRGVLVGSIVAAAIGIIFTLVVAVIRHFNVPTGFWVGAVRPLTAWAGPIMLYNFGIFGSDNFRYYFLPLLGLSFLISCLAALGILLADKFFTLRPHLLAIIGRQLDRANILLAILALLVGIAGTYVVDVYYAPYFPIAPGNYDPPVPIFAGTEIDLHFNAASAWQHRVSFIAYAYAIFVNAMPTVYWLSMLAALLVTRLTQQRQKIDLGLELLWTGALLMPLVFGLFQIRVWNRYFNIGLFLFVMVVSLKVTEALTTLPAKKKAAFGGIFAVLLLAEILPFRPLYGAFRPIWAHYDDSTPIKGKLNPAWLGWGEDIMLAGQALENQCHLSGNNTLNGIPCNSITLYWAYPGEWLDENKEITVLPYQKIYDKLASGEPVYTAANYYLINRSNIIQEDTFPAEVPPDVLISFRRYPQTWVYRLDRLKEAGYEFIRPNEPFRLARWQTEEDYCRELVTNSPPAAPVLCEVEPRGEFYELWQREKWRLGCPLHPEPVTTEAIEVPFERGRMFWLGNLSAAGERLVITIYGGQELGEQGTFLHTWQHDQPGYERGQPEYGCSADDPPPGKFQPTFGIGQVWCQPEVFDKIGWATGPEEHPSLGVILVQDFEKAVLLRDNQGYTQGLVYVLGRADGQYIRLPYAAWVCEETSH
ncbi:MAG: hypothetical protein JW953_06575 [Anaerolineae bacterium]|nr:hypothetical protein [Anaerolineae bacterium]